MDVIYGNKLVQNYLRCQLCTTAFSDRRLKMDLGEGSLCVSAITILLGLKNHKKKKNNNENEQHVLLKSENNDIFKRLTFQNILNNRKRRRPT